MNVQKVQSENRHWTKYNYRCSVIASELNIRSVRSGSRIDQKSNYHSFSGSNPTNVTLWTEPEPNQNNAIQFDSFLKEPKVFGKNCISNKVKKHDFSINKNIN